MLVKNEIQTMDNLLLVDIPSYEGHFYQFGEIINRPMHPNKVKGELLSVNLYLKSESIFHVREVFTLFDLVGDLGGVIEVLIITLGILLYPISEHSFLLSASKLLFKARTND